MRTASPVTSFWSLIKKLKAWLEMATRKLSDEQADALVQAVMDPYANYEQGWDIVAETYSKAEIREVIQGATIPADAIAKIGRIVNLLSERHREIDATA